MLEAKRVSCPHFKQDQCSAGIRILSLTFLQRAVRPPGVIPLGLQPILFCSSFEEDQEQQLVPIRPSLKLMDSFGALGTLGEQQKLQQDQTSQACSRRQPSLASVLTDRSPSMATTVDLNVSPGHRSSQDGSFIQCKALLSGVRSSYSASELLYDSVLLGHRAACPPSLMHSLPKTFGPMRQHFTE
ncbi:hypothetical protein D918_02189 [Trichuris suis]|nr:hypothetical protein D918_02189 [Trichuris suis]